MEKRGLRSTKYFYRKQFDVNCWFGLALQHRALRNLLPHRQRAPLAPSVSKGRALGQRHVVLHGCKNQRVGMGWMTLTLAQKARLRLSLGHDLELGLKFLQPKIFETKFIGDEKP